MVQPIPSGAGGSMCAREVAAVALAIFRASFHEDDSDELVRQCWNEWEDDRAAAHLKEQSA